MYGQKPINRENFFSKNNIYLRTVSGLSAPDFIPDHVKLDKKVIHFKGYYSEEIVESPIETERVRYLDVYYYLTDDTVMISEPHIQNSGITQETVNHKNNNSQKKYHP